MFRLQLRKSPPPPAAREAPANAFPFLDTPRVINLIDGELELVEPHEQYVDDLLAACRHPLTRKDMPVQAKTTRDSLVEFLAANPRGHAAPNPAKQIAPGYTFWMHTRPGPWESGLWPHHVAMAGSISLRLGHSENLDFYLGHIGYHVLPPARGHHYAERACRMLLPLARSHGQKQLWITCNPDNLASRRTIERLGAILVDIVAVPRDNALYSQGDRQKCRYLLDL